MKISYFEKDGGVDPEAIGSGVYHFKIGKYEEDKRKYKSLYIGESYSMLIRCANHLYELSKDKSYFGLQEDNWSNEKLELIVEVYEPVTINNLSTSDRDILLREKELEAIMKMKPLSQLETSDRLNKYRVEIVQNALEEIFE